MIKQLNKSTVETVGRPVRILQFGEGNFLRAFVDWQIDIANEKGVMDAGVAVCQPIIDPERKVLGMIDLMHRQDNMYHVYLEGIENKRPKKDVRLVKSIMDSFNPYVDYAKYEAYFLSPELKITISNTTEAGIRYEEGDDLTACPPKSYPAKMTALLYKRFKHFNGDRQGPLHHLLRADREQRLDAPRIRHQTRLNTTNSGRISSTGSKRTVISATRSWTASCRDSRASRSARSGRRSAMTTTLW